MRGLVSLSAALLLGAALAGCMGGDEPAPAPAPAATNMTVLDTNTTVDDGTTEMPMDVGHMPHLHDYWQDKERITIMDEEIAIDPFTAIGFTFMDVFMGTPAVGGTFVQLPDGAIVYEGTGQLEFTATWSDPTMTGVGLRYKSPDSSDFAPTQALASSTPLVIEVTPDMTDMPHDKSSRWGFLLLPPGAGNAMVGNIQIKIDIIRVRDIMTFPGHPQLFNGEHTLALYSGPAKSTSQSFASRIAGFATQSSADSSVASQKVVPMETASMTANVTITSATASVGKVASVDFLYKPASSMFGYQRAQVLFADAEAGVYQFAWPVEMTDTDSPYAEESQWRFDLLIRGDPTGTGSQMQGLTDAQVDYTLDVVAYDSLLEGIEPVQDEGEDS